MSLYAERRCKPCEGGVVPFSEKEAREALGSLADGWALTKDGRELLRDYRFPNFLRTMSFVNAVAHIANVEDHHPDLEIGYDYCRIRYTTHAIQGLCENDFICAAKIDRL
jgi:4a-hydroxytetrahydrobiopterin dehydratase